MGMLLLEPWERYLQVSNFARKAILESCADHVPKHFQVCEGLEACCGTASLAVDDGPMAISDVWLEFLASVA